ncbi:hypothetical protein I2492_18790 [Budviciaceae bacterium CWB-B4]|uniref:Uncharacterized protein n=1 Tax=Limnobaculum xujianqingii TaxID=2738837 RepID=A0A9D7ALC5_9GAMM|nr:hypothetical protein [Limnobaculum xujianqingii]MBK5075104.1 hypothetical protein [Limnobaculum xujianqingii]MBK5178361.1 hypothetical protein [Limnobaculum xujianqingii]
MSWRTLLPLAAGGFLLVAFFLWFSSQRYNAGYQSADNAWQIKWHKRDADSSMVITANVLKEISLFNTVMEANRDAKQKITLESQGATEDIKTAVTGDGCAIRSIPADAVKRLREHADRIRSGTAGTNSR